MRTSLWTDFDSCYCNHLWTDHEYPGRQCAGDDSYGVTCSCPSFELDPPVDEPSLAYCEWLLVVADAELAQMPDWLRKTPRAARRAR